MRKRSKIDDPSEMKTFQNERMGKSEAVRIRRRGKSEEAVKEQLVMKDTFLTIFSPLPLKIVIEFVHFLLAMRSSHFLCRNLRQFFQGASLQEEEEESMKKLKERSMKSRLSI